MNNKLYLKSSEWYKYYTGDFHDTRKNQFISIFYQVKDIIIKTDISSVLEFGTGRNVSKAIIEHFGIKHYSVDFDNKRFIPDEVSTIMEFKSDKKFDIVCAFQVLEHNPLDSIKDHLTKMKSLSKEYVFISVPYSGRWISINLEMNFLPTRFGRWRKNIFFTWPRLFKKARPIEQYRLREDKYSPHWWEVGDKNLSKKDFTALIENSGLKIEKEFHNEYFPYHLFYLLKKTSINQIT